jgi:hypothetical protein
MSVTTLSHETNHVNNAEPTVQTTESDPSSELDVDTNFYGDIDPETLYFDDGSVNIEAVRNTFKGRRSGQSHPLDDLTIGSMGFEFPRHSESDNREALEAYKRHDPIGYAIIMMNVADIVGSMEISFAVFDIDRRLYDDPEWAIDTPSALNKHFNFLAQNTKISYSLIREAQAKMGESPNDVNGIRGIVAIPVAGHQEYKNIYNTLAQFAKQDIDPREFELLLHINLSYSLPDGTEDQEIELANSLKLTLAEVERFKRDYPQIVTRFFTVTYGGDSPTIGRIRSDLWETAGYDLMTRGIDKDVLVVSSDADVVSLNPGYLRAMFKTFETTEADIVTANLKWQNAPSLPYTATVNRILRYQTFLDLVRDAHDQLHPADANTGISLGMYFASGGYNRNDSLGEMWNLVQRIKALRSHRTPDEHVLATEPTVKAHKAWLRTHSRRLIATMALGHSPYDAWNQSLITFGTDDKLRTEEMQEALAEQMAQSHWKKWVKEMPSGYMDGIDARTKYRLLKNARRILGFSGLYKSSED